ncbi:hypothetical protein GLOTRDRAFT_131737 [Gloeophyllum trabeum ATCC 11539]|uniref:Cytochrome P450 n=1 Tax=Gloeophyllum trabeum (strain ATCC 11539 / FP-39264 / Madison 617) TaxID=670483 RepID=S7RE83_GLOTA|nr:uncharacterized protein GLOTRDRAFT_131737 [Gloeophyllum trabeum ATCC 11539]EPQ52495.1 hypothetical protein GLOTRDRAFT_131737 [Gloeophyllum trabeum ATCC 11539]
MTCAEGRAELSLSDMENMPYLQAVLKEALRLHPIEFQASHVAEKDTILPLGEPIMSVSGKEIKELHVPKGTEVMFATGCYNR